MKFIFLFLIFELIFSYEAEDALNYAKEWCQGYNPRYNEYGLDESEEANFVSQSLFAGGESFSGCTGKDWWGMVYTYNNLMACLKAKGWEQSEERNSSFLPGYPLILKDERGIMIAKGFEGNQTFYYRHQDKNECTGHRPDSQLIFLYKK